MSAGSVIDRRSALIAVGGLFGCRTERRAAALNVKALPEQSLLTLVDAWPIKGLHAQDAGDTVLDRSDNVYVINRARQSIMKIRSHPPVQQTEFGADNIGSYRLNRPVRITVNAEGELVVLEAKPFRVATFDQGGSLTSSFLYVAEHEPGVAVAPFTRGRLLIGLFASDTSRTQYLVHEYTMNGQPIRSFLPRDSVVVEKRIIHFAGVELTPSVSSDDVLAVQPCSPTVYRLYSNGTVSPVITSVPKFFVPPPEYPRGVKARSEEQFKLDAQWIQVFKAFDLPSGKYIRAMFNGGSRRPYLLEVFDRAGAPLTEPVETAHQPIAVTRDGLLVSTSVHQGAGDFEIRFSRISG